ncbi:hypothetical protein PpBr36_05501 [Pyricularia pennisetigena]|uniref:hypothetical protein n=1 Tax=Pyricularia pennisetigena TaxID=1578925 RepID=UPI0011505EA0|nr:hypothetical protein PpBr36_05501 [Pyricularia pennisetigena]TLS27231.1 hypothetical protein PpBr36_05501 [Pyricularia pennisetigena]
MDGYQHRLASTLQDRQDHMLVRRSTEMNHDGAKSLPSPAVMTLETRPISPPFSSSQLGPLPSLNLHHKPRDSPTLASFSDIPSNELAPIALDRHRCSLSPIGSQNSAPILPPIATLTQSLEPLRLRTPSQPQTSPPVQEQRRPSPPRLTSWPTGNPLTTYYTPSHAQAAESPARMDVDMSTTPRAGSVSLDDPDVRMAAEALGDLRADFVSTPKQPAQSQRPQQEPILQLLTTSHPLLAKTIEGTTTAYNTSKNYSPRFKSGAEYVEGYLTPIGNTLGSVGRVTGVEGGVRWFLKGSARRQPSSSDLESGESSRSKRRRMMPSGDEETEYAEDRRGIMSPPPPPSNMEFDPFAYRSKERRMSMSTVDSLPAYDDAKSPAYTEAAGDDQRSPVPRSPAWQSRLIMSTSGLSIAMSEESLRSLKYCLQWLRWANDRIANAIGALKVTLEQFERHPETGEVTSKQVTIEIPIDGAMVVDESRPNEAPERRSNEELGQRVAALKSDVLKTLRAVIETVSKYAGGALPDNARVLVKRHLTSLPQRFKLASQADQSSAGPSSSGSNSEKDVREGAQRVLVLAQEGLDMMAQVSGVLDGTIVSAEEWCARLGKKKQDERAALTGAASQPEKPLEPLTSVGIDGDVKMG